jgi:glucose/arabinose dehydrogenase
VDVTAQAGKNARVIRLAAEAGLGLDITCLATASDTRRTLMKKLLLHRTLQLTALWLALPLLAHAQLSLERVASGLSAPLFLGAPAGDQRLFVVEKGGTIKIVQNGTVLPNPFLDISSLINAQGERGLLGLAFDPNYAANGRFYVNYIDKVSLDTVVARFTTSTTDLNRADFNSRQTILTVDQPAPENHKAGWIGFRPNEPNNLYIATGDGGGSNDPENRAQNISDNLGKILRIDVSGSIAGYTIPAGNPFVGTAGNDEIWASGLRNPFRNSFDRLTGDFYIADVGESAREEINFEAAPGTAGRNYGWRAREGTLDNGAVGDPRPTGAVDPIFEYDRNTGRSVTGGYVYRGSRIPHFQGTYLFGDFIFGRFFSFRYNGTSLTEFQNRDAELDPSNVLFAGGSLSSFGEDGFGELYAVNYGGSIYRLIPEPSSAVLLLCGSALLLRRRRAATQDGTAPAL